MTPTDDSAPPAGLRRPEGRYGPERRGMSRRTATVAVAAALLAAVAWAAYVAFGPGNRGVSFLDVGYRVVGDDRVEVTFEVQKAPDRTAVCRVRALNEGFAEVGLADVTIGPSDRRATTVTAVVRTTEPAVSGAVKACTLR